jgi:hypothetical protein
LELCEILKSDLESIAAFPPEAWQPLWDWLTAEWGGAYPYVPQGGDAVILRDIAHNLAKFCVMVGWNANNALSLAALVQVRLGQLYGGAFVYVPRQDTRKGRDAAIYDEFNGSNLLELSRKYRVGFTSIYKAIHRERTRRGKERAGGLQGRPRDGAELGQDCA